MTAAAPVEAGAGSLAAAGKLAGTGNTLPSAKAGRMSGLMQSASSSAAGSASSSTTADSFRARWQSMLASLNANPSEAEAQDSAAEVTATSINFPSFASAAKTYLSRAATQPAQATEETQPATNEKAAETGAANRMSTLASLEVKAAAAQTTEANPASAADSLAATSSDTRASSRSGAHSAAHGATAKQSSSSQSSATAQLTALAANPLLPITAPVSVPVALEKTSSHASSSSVPAGLWTTGEAEGSRNPSASSSGHSAVASIASKPTALATSATGPLTANDNAITHSAQAAEPAAAQQSGSNESSAPASSAPAFGNADAASSHQTAHSTQAQTTATDVSASISASQSALAGSASVDSASASSASSNYPASPGSSSPFAAVDAKKAEAVRNIFTSTQNATHLGSGSQPASHPVVNQADGVSPSVSVQARVQTDAASSAPATTSASTSHDPFAALDSGSASAAPSWIHAGAHTAEAGYQDPSLGWVGVRAEVSGGSIHASLVPGSADAAQVLGSHMAGLNNYLAEQHTPVATLTMAVSTTGGQPDASAGQSMQQGQNSGSDAQAHASSTAPASISTAAASTAAASPAATGPTETINPAVGHHISVMA